MRANFVDAVQATSRENNMWPAVLVPREEIEQEIERLGDIARPSNGRRESMVVHPNSTEPGLGFAPGIDVTISVLKPGEKTPPRRHNSSMAAICLRGTGRATIKGRSIEVEKFDVWNTPSMNGYTLENTGKDLFVCLVYSNAPVLRKLEVFYQEEEGQLPADWNTPLPPRPAVRPARSKDSLPPIKLGADGATLLAYEHLVDPDFVDNHPLHWPYQEVSRYFGNVRELDQNYIGRRLYLLYNPATEKRNGTTHSFFATLTSSGPNRADRPHRHCSAAINYYLVGSGYSKVGGVRMEWKAGDLQFSAPGWMIHGHASGPEGFEALTIQDHPFHIANESLIWQENLKGPVLNLGAEEGFETNIQDYLSVAGQS